MPRLRRPAPLLCGLAALALLALGGCAPGPGGTSVFGELGYLGQAAAGQGRLLLRARPIAAALRDPGVPAQTRHKLALVVQARDFAVAELGLGNTRSFQTYSDVGPGPVVWNVYSAPRLSLSLDQRCFPVVGCVTYQGYFSEAAARAEARRRAAGGERDVAVGGASAYSTLGYLPDPVLSSALEAPDTTVIRTVLHELAHATLYVAGDTTYSESYAVAAEDALMEGYLARFGTPELRAQDEAQNRFGARFDETTLRARSALAAVYASGEPAYEQARRKAEILETLRREHAELLGGRVYNPASPYASGLNNASLGAYANYSALVPAFRAQWERRGRVSDLVEAARRCARAEAGGRQACLQKVEPPSITPAGDG